MSSWCEIYQWMAVYVRGVSLPGDGTGYSGGDKSAKGRGRAVDDDNDKLHRLSINSKNKRN